MQFTTLLQLMIFTSLVSAAPLPAALTAAELKKLNKVFSSDGYKAFASSRSNNNADENDRAVGRSETGVLMSSSKLRDGRQT